MKEAFIRAVGWGYRTIGTKAFFIFDSEPIHEFMLEAGNVMAKVPGVVALTRAMLRVRRPSVATEVAGIHFENPVGLAAGFDHEGRLPYFIGALGFGFESIGTVTNGVYEGNPYPRIKRLVKSRSLLINKGFKSRGIDAALARFKRPFSVPIGISLGQTNRAYASHEDAIGEICAAFKKTIASGIPFAYYELNISCPNLNSPVSFYDPVRLDQLLKAIRALGAAVPLFIKMPIGLSDDTTLALADIARSHGVAALIVGNLQHDRSDPAFDAEEVRQYEGVQGNWSGMPCQRRSDDLVRLVYRHTRGALPIIGCGGIFTAQDAYRKVRLGASLVQIATAPVFMGPQIAAEITAGFAALLERDGFSSLAEAVGVDARST